jgi:hypothetical protein
MAGRSPHSSVAASAQTSEYATTRQSLRYADGHKRRLGAHSAGLNEIVDLKELMKIGYQPFTLKIVSAKPAGATHPTIVSRVPSIQVDLADDDLPGHTPLLLRNVFSRSILAYALDVGGGSSVWSAPTADP